MRALSYRQAYNCEHARGPKCACRCGGRFHGAGRVSTDADRGTFETALPEGDPHRLPPLKRRRRRTAENQTDAFAAKGDHS